MRVQRAPNVSATQPRSGDPNGVPPMKTIVERHHPAAQLGAVRDICTKALAAVIIVSAVKPRSGVSSANVRYVGISPATISTMPKTSAAPMTSRSRTRVAAGGEQRAGQRADGQDRAEEAVLAGALAVDLGRHQRGRHLEVQPERADEEHRRR